jgi:hypothetical protein
MRNVFLALVVLNLLFFAWAEWIDAPHETVAPEGLSKLPRLKLVDDAQGGADTPAGSAQKMSLRAPASALPDDSGAAAACTSIGPFRELSSAAKAAGMLRTVGLNPSQRAAQGELLSGYWVFIDGLDAEELLTVAVQLLQKSGITDVHVMKPSPAGRRISAGLFSNRDGAERRAQAVRQIGMQAEVAERTFRGPVYWLDVPLPDPAAGMHLQGLLSRDGYQAAVSEVCPRQFAPQETLPQPDTEDSIIRSLPRTTVASVPGSPGSFVR